MLEIQILLQVLEPTESHSHLTTVKFTTLAIPVSKARKVQLLLVLLPSLLSPF
jgi:hypothetical protein